MSGYRFDRLKVLVVDDNAHMRKLVVTILQAFGVLQVYEADSGNRGPRDHPTQACRPGTFVWRLARRRDRRHPAGAVWRGPCACALRRSIDGPPTTA